MSDRKRDPALFNLAIDSKHRGCDALFGFGSELRAVSNALLLYFLRGSSPGLMYVMFQGPVAVSSTTVSSSFHR
jgi:hypothetical protein